TDDQGWTDTSVAMMRQRPDSKSDFYRTPHLERLARGGLVFSSAYSPAPVCSPSRNSS
ncbi:MAG: sulfatase-like hydrolase/transferase, partial [Candidatus Zixiibacteriota bacterium]